MSKIEPGLTSAEQVFNLIVSAAYGDAGLKEKLYVWYLTLKDKKYREIYDEYKQTARQVHKIKLEVCPADILKKVYEHAEENPGSNEESRISFLFGSPVIAAVVSAVILASAVITMELAKRPQPPEQKQYTQQELSEAEKQVKMSLQLVNEVFNKTTKKIGQEILPQKVGRPIKQGLEIINQILPKGVKPDEKS